MVTRRNDPDPNPNRSPGVAGLSNQTRSSQSDMSSSTRQFTPSSTFSSGTVLGNSPDIPLPSIERDFTPSSTSNSGESASTTIFTPPRGSVSGSENASLNHDLENLRIAQEADVEETTPRTPVSFRRQSSSVSSVPDVQVTPPPSVATSFRFGSNEAFDFVPRMTPGNQHREQSSSSRSPQAGRLVSRSSQSQSSSNVDAHSQNGRRGSSIGSVANDVGNMNLRSTNSPALSNNARPGTSSPEMIRDRDGLSLSPSPSPSPFGQRPRSGSGVSRSSHAVENEEPPRSLYYEREFQEALTKARNLTGEIVNILSSSVLHTERGSTIQKLYEQANQLNGFQPPSTRIVGLVGDSGAGKSSLINSLLDQNNLARAANSGAACTCVVTEYHFHGQDNFIVDVNYFSVDELRNQLGQLLSAYREYINLRDSPSSRSTGSSNQRRDLEESKKMADLAMYTFKAAFEGQVDLSEQALVRESLETTLQAMMEYVHAEFRRMRWSGRPSESANDKHAFNSHEPCSEKLAELTSETGAGRRTAWPLIRKINVYLNAFILSKGLVIADLPGLRDLNLARQKITERYLRDCHQIFAVTNIGRAETDVSVKEIFELAQQARLSNVGIVCTRVDDIRPDEAVRDLSQAEMDTLEKIQEEIENLSSELEDLLENIDELEDPDREASGEEDRQLHELYRKHRRKEKARAHAEFKQKRYLIIARNQKVSRQLQTLWRNHPIVRDLQTFCVSNTIYWDKRSKPSDEALPYLHLSGILDLRRHCISIVADSHYRATIQYIKEEIPALLGSIQIWVEAGAGGADAERKQRIRNVANQIQRQLNGMLKLTTPTSELHQVSQVLLDTFNDQVAADMRQNEPAWRANARRRSLMWAGYHFSTYAAFCRRNGVYLSPKTTNNQLVNWNEEAFSNMLTVMPSLLPALQLNARTILDRNVDRWRSAFDEIQGRIRHETADGQGGLNATYRTLMITMIHRRRILLQKATDIIGQFDKYLLTFERDACTVISTSAIMELLGDTYDAAVMEHGTGSHARRKGHIESGFGSLTLFSDHRSLLREKFSEIALDIEGKLVELLEEQVNLVQNDLNTLKDENAVLESERYPEFRRRVDVEVRRAMRETERLREVIDRVERTSTGVTIT